MGRARPLLPAIAVQRQREEDRENQREPGIIPNGEWGADIRMLRNDGEGVLGRGNNFVFLGRSRSFPALANIPIRKQPHTQPTVWLWDPDAKVNLPAPIPYFPQNNTLPSHPNLSSFPPCPCHNICPCHGLPPTPPLPILVIRRLHQSQKTDEPPSKSIGHFNTTPYFFIYLFFFSLLSKGIS